ncbi:Disease resistance protein RPS5 [Vitis vinifera]|uniref:Disease resistance protein RPS5 n=1 Tax=Vitis vinifera TaxID=29760 RepID=A0A438GY07_VITVI|nr:Disease resistance protein RPS5 [Vitis vinifera]
MALRPVVDELPLGHTVGLDSLSQRVRSCFDEHAVGIVGLYGVRGVGKTTLLKKTNNDFLLRSSYDFNLVIWVTVSNQASVTAAQEVIANKLQINGRMWKNRSQDEKAIEIFNIMKRKSEMGAQRRFKVGVLPSTEALNLFMLMVREDTLSSHPIYEILPTALWRDAKACHLHSLLLDEHWPIRILSGNGKKPIQKLEKLPTRNFRLPGAVVDEMPLGHIVGLDRLYERVCRCLTDHKKEKVQESVRAAQEGILTQLQIPDSMWQGVPPLPEIQYQSKVIITTRLQKTCTEMEVERKFRVECLEQEEALALFMKKVGENTLNSHPDIPQLAEKVAERCKGLPLALVTVGRAMADKNSPEKWDQAIQELEKFPVEISGFFDRKDIYEARRRGHKIIEDLKNASLLEEGDGFKECIKMHDVIHDMALWIGQECGKKMNKILVCESLGHVEAERVTSWKEAERISLWGWNIEKLPETPHCSNLQTLFVRECIQLKTFPRGFFQFMPLIRVLDLSATHCLTELPDGIDRLMNLEYINLSMTQVKELPIEIMKLTKLRCLLLDGMLPLNSSTLISSLSSLQLFSMYDGNALSAFRTTLLEELESIEAMDELSLSFRNVAALNKLLSSYKLQRGHCSSPLEIISVINCPRLRRLPIDSNSATKSLKKIEGDLTWWGRLEWEDESVEEIFTNYFSPQYLADPIQHSGKEETGGRRFNLKCSHLNTASQAQKLKLLREQDECSKCDGIKLFAYALVLSVELYMLLKRHHFAGVADLM